MRQDKRLGPVSAAIPGRMSMEKKKSNRKGMLLLRNGRRHGRRMDESGRAGPEIMT